MAFYGFPNSGRNSLSIPLDQRRVSFTIFAKDELNGTVHRQQSHNRVGWIYDENSRISAEHCESGKLDIRHLIDP